MLQDPIVKKSRTSGTRYYERLQIEDEFRVATDKHMFDNEVERRFQRYKLEKEKELNERRERLVRLLQFEERLNRELGRQKLENERMLHRDALLEEAKRLKEEVKKKNEEVAEEKYQLQFIQNNAPLREQYSKQHLAEIMKDRREIEILRAWDKYYQAKEDALLEARKTLLDEQLEREERDAEKAKALAYDYAAQHLADVADKMERRAIEKRKNDEEAKKQYELLRLEDESKGGSLEEQRKKRHELLLDLRKDAEESRKRKDDERRREKIVESYCRPLLESDKNQKDTIKKEALRQEQLKFIEYQKSVAEAEECYDKHLDYIYAEMDANRREQERKRRLQERDRSLKVAKEIVAAQKEMIAKKLENEKAEKAMRVEAARNLTRKIKEQEELIRVEERERYEKALQHANDLIEQCAYNRVMRDKNKQQELEREREAMAKAEGDYNRRMKEAMENNLLMLKIHPWRQALVNKSR